MTYPPCHLTESYPILLAVPVEARAQYVEQAQQGHRLTAGEARALGSDVLIGMVLIPSIPNAVRSAQQLAAIFVDDPQPTNALFALARKEVTAKQSVSITG